MAILRSPVRCLAAIPSAFSATLSGGGAQRGLYPPMHSLLTYACGNRFKRVARLHTPDTYWGMRSTGLIVLPAAASAAAQLMAASS
jgi:hypothetical protein